MTRNLYPVRCIWHTRHPLTSTCWGRRPDGSAVRCHWTFAMGPGVTMYDRSAGRWMASDEWYWDIESRDAELSRCASSGLIDRIERELDARLIVRVPAKAMDPDVVRMFEDDPASPFPIGNFPPEEEFDVVREHEAWWLIHKPSGAFWMISETDRGWDFELIDWADLDDFLAETSC